MPSKTVRGLFVGLATLDTIYRVASPPGPNQKTTAHSQELAAGGPAANAALTFAALGGQATLVTSLGSHVLARFAAAELQERQVAVRDAARDYTGTPAVSSIYVSDGSGERSVVSVNAAHQDIPVPDWLPEALDGADVVLLDGHHPRLAVAAARLAHEARVPVVLDAGSWKPVYEELIPCTSFAVCSADLRVPASDDAATALLRQGVPMVAVTHGPDPVHWSSRNARGTVEVPGVEARDTLGAGDVFHGAFAYALARTPSAPPGPLLRFAAHVAALRCTVPGPRRWLDTPEFTELTVLANRLGDH
ncbi:PfkB family carbohydrate kinase [Streptomyces sp. NPDC005708]|uniref:PfkB family carbohydrate kinase n=1 Tax=Streptomyces sp. NPDC005708 TaxID=3154564 RepID=UPI0033E525C7